MIKEGNICDEIVREVQENGCVASIVMGKSKESKSDNILIPSIAAKMGSEINIPLVIIPGEIDDGELKGLV